MNTVGKILVILNFLFAIIVGLLLVVDIALRNKWKEAHDSLVADARVQAVSTNTNTTATRKVLSDYQQKQKELADLTQKIYDLDQLMKLKEGEFDAQVIAMQTALKAKELVLTDAREAQQRLVNEIDVQSKAIKDRETTIVRLEADVKNLRISAVQFEAQSRTFKIQNENLLAQLQEVNLALTRERAGVVSADVMVIRNPNEPNPPTAKVDGKIEKVDGDLMVISLGTDNGVNKNHTLDVYRLTPEPKYLGMVRIVDANLHQSVARLVPSGNAAFRTPVRAGDLVASKLTK